MLTINLKQDWWPIVVLISGMIILYEFLPAYIENQALDGDKSAVTTGVVEKKRTYHRFWGSSTEAPYHEVRYRFQVDEEDYRGQHDSQCDELRRVQKGDSIDVRYARSDPTRSRPAVVSYYTPWLLFWNVAAVVLLVVGLAGCGHKLWGKGGV